MRFIGTIRNLILTLFLIIILFNCSTIKTKKELTYDFDQLFSMAQDNTIRGKYQTAINMLNDLLVKYPYQDILAINYNIGYNYYKQNKTEDATKYFNLVITQFETVATNDTFIAENRKFVVLSEVILEKIKKEAEDKKDPYHVKEDLEKTKKVKAKTKKQKPIIEK